MGYGKRMWIFAAVLGALAAPAWSGPVVVCNPVNQFTVSAVFTGGSLQAFTGNSQQTVIWTYDYTNSREAFQYLASDGSVAQTTIWLYRGGNQGQYDITGSTGKCVMSPLSTNMPQAAVPGTFSSSTQWLIGGALQVTGYSYSSLFSFGPILPNPSGGPVPQFYGQQVQFVVGPANCIPISWSWSWGLASVAADFRNYAPTVNSATFTLPPSCLKP